MDDPPGRTHSTIQSSVGDDGQIWIRKDTLLAWLRQTRPVGPAAAVAACCEFRDFLAAELDHATDPPRRSRPAAAGPESRS